MEFVGLNLKEKVIEFFLMLSGNAFYHVVLRPVHSLRSRRGKKHSPAPKRTEPRTRSGRR